MTCPVCSGQIELKSATRKSGKPSLHLRCSNSGAHFRAFINDEDYIQRVMERTDRHDPDAG